MAAPRGLQGQINQIASRPTDPNIDKRLDEIRQAEAIYSARIGGLLEEFLNDLVGLGRKGPHVTAELDMHARNHIYALLRTIRSAREASAAQLQLVLANISHSPQMEDLIKEMKKQLVRDEQVANPRRLALLGAISSTKGLPGQTTSHPVDAATGATLERDAAGGPTALIAQMIGSRANGVPPHIRTSKPPPAPPPPRNAADDAYFAGLYDGGRRRRRTRRHTRRR
uniref:Uncharacterized protein n=1 Tax=viral metagenome TaxID=1070528 RepID=A0A6C0F308_9ZZZZ